MSKRTILNSSLAVCSGRQSGAVAITVAFLMIVFLMFAALAIDVGYAMVTRNELQNIADGAALAGTRTLGRLYECNGNISTCTAPMHYEDQQTYEADEVIIKKAVTDVAFANQAGGKTGIVINAEDIVIGRWNTSTKQISPITLTSPDAVQVIARRDSNANSPISTFLAHVMGIDALDISAVATAALTGSSSVGPGGLPIPVALNKSWISTLPCNQDLTFHPSSAGVCAAWHSYLPTKDIPTDGYSPNANSMRDLVDDTADLSFQSPETTAGQTKYEFTNGTLASLFTGDYIQNLFNTMKVRNDGTFDGDKDSNTWTTSIPIFDDLDVGCAPNGDVTIVGFTTIVITQVSPPPETTISGKVLCNNVEPGRGGGGSFGTKGSIPGLVR